MMLLLMYGVMFEEAGRRCRWKITLPLRTVRRPRVSGRGELRGPWQGLGRISFPRIEIAPSFLLDNIVEILMATGVRMARLGSQFGGIKLQVGSSSWVGTLSPNDTHVIVWGARRWGSRKDKFARPLPHTIKLFCQSFICHWRGCTSLDSNKLRRIIARIIAVRQFQHVAIQPIIDGSFPGGIRRYRLAVGPQINSLSAEVDTSNAAGVGNTSHLWTKNRCCLQ